MKGLMMDYPLTIDRILERANRVYPHKSVRTKEPDGSMHHYTYGHLYRRVKRLGNVLDHLGVRPGDRVGTFAWNHYQHLELYFGIPGAGAVCHTLNIRLFPDQLAFIINHAEDKVIFVDGSLLPLLERVADQIGGVGKFVLMNAPKGSETKLRNVFDYEELMAEADEAFEWRVTEETDAMGLCYTSGTTGEPKGVVYSHRSMYLHTLGAGQASALALTESDVVLPVVPQFHAMAWGIPYLAPNVGAELVLPGPDLSPAALAELIEGHHVTVAAGVPTIWTGLFHELKARPRDLSSIRALVVGGAAMPRALIEGYEKELGVNVLHAWGMTETSPLGTVSVLQSAHRDLPDEEKWAIKAKQGYPVPGIELRIVGENGSELPWDGATMGEVQVRGPWVAKEYFQVGASPEHFTSDGWFRTGDVATVTEDGFMQITDRAKDLIKSGGEWISSVAVENALMAYPSVGEAAVIAIPDEKWGERPLAVIVAAPDSEAPSEEDLRAHLLAQFPRFWLPEKIVFLDEIPKTSVGKFDRKVLRNRYAEGELA